jgi:hypothetical protein
MNGSRMITILTPAQIAQDPTLVSSLVIVGVVLLLVLLALRELAANSDEGWPGLAASLNIAIVPLMMSFVVAMAVAVGNWLRAGAPR